MKPNGTQSRTCGNCKHWGEEFAQIVPKVGLVAPCRAVNFPAIKRFDEQMGPEQIIGGVQVPMPKDGGCGYYFQPKLQALLNWTAKSSLSSVKTQVVAAQSEPVPEPA